MNNNILIAIAIAILGSVLVATVVNKFRQAFVVSEGYAGLLYLSVPGCFVRLKNGQADSAPNIEESGAS